MATIKQKWINKKEVQAKKKEEAKQIKKAVEAKKAKELIMEKLAQNHLTSAEVGDEEKELFVSLYAEWEPGVSYKPNEKISHNGNVFEVIQAHTSQPDWEPQNVPALFKVVYQTQTSGGDEVVNDWVQPGSTNPYNIGDKVRFNGEVYESKITGNVWSPAGYPQGWTKL